MSRTEHRLRLWDEAPRRAAVAAPRLCFAIEAAAEGRDDGLSAALDELSAAEEADAERTHRA